MFRFLLKAMVGTLLGTLVGLTGFGSGVLLLPILIPGLQVPPIIAVGSDAIFSSLTKLGAGFLHWRQGTVNWRSVAPLSLGSLPSAALLGVWLSPRLPSPWLKRVLCVAHWRLA